MDDPAYLQGFKGFTNGLCYVSICANDVDSTAKLVVQDIAAFDETQTVIVDNTPPALVVDFDE